MKLKVTVDGKTYEVEVEASEPERPAVQPVAAAQVRAVAAPVVAPPPPAGGAPVADESKVCRSPISGTVVRVTAQEGQSMQPGDVMMVLEAMKMETNITAPVAAKVGKVNVKVGEAVKTGQVLVEFA